MSSETANTGLKEGAISTAEVIIMGIAGDAPVMCMGGSLGLMLALTGTGSALSVICAGALCVVFGLCFGYLARNYNCCGGSYSYITRVFGTKAGLWTAFVYYGVAFTLSGGPAYMFTSYLNTLTGIPPLAGFFIFYGIIFCVSWLGIELSMKATITVFVIEMVLVLIPAVEIIGMNPGSFSLATAMHNAFVPGNGVSGVFAGMALWVMAFVGFEAASFMGEELKSGWRGVRIAAPLSAVGIMIVYVVAFWLWTAAMTPDQMAEVAASYDPFATYCQMLNFAVGEKMVCVSVMLAALACSLAIVPMMTRFMYDQGRTGLLPKSITKMNKHQVPYVATIVYTIMGFCCFLYGVFAYGGVFEGMSDVFSVCSINAMSSYAFIALACVKERWTEKGVNALVIGRILPILAVVVVLYAIFFASGVKYAILTLIWYAVAAVLAFAFSKRVNRETLAS